MTLWPTPRSLRLSPSIVALVLLSAAAAAGAPPSDGTAAPAAERAQEVLRMPGYVSVDYPGTVDGGRVANPSEYAEQVEFAGKARAALAALPPTPERPALLADADRLVAMIGDKRPGEEVA